MTIQDYKLLDFLYKEYADLEKREGYSLKELGSYRDYAYKKNSALKVIQFFKKMEAEILGCAVYIFKDNSIKDAYEAWSCGEIDRHIYKTDQEYLEQTWIQSEKYIRDYPELKDQTVLFEITKRG